MNDVPAVLRAELDQHLARVRDLCDKDSRVADELHSRTSVGRVMSSFARIVANDIYLAGAWADMELRALAWVEYMEELDGP